MSRKYKFKNPDGIYFISFTVVYWIDVFIRRKYKNILVESINYCVENKGLAVYCWVIMSNHVHMIIQQKGEIALHDILRDLKKFTSKALIKEIQENPQESRKEWMLRMFEHAGKRNSNNKKYQFWQQHNHPMELDTNTNSIDRVINYIHNNPVKAGFVDNPENYPYSSAIDFAGNEGLIKLESVL